MNQNSLSYWFPKLEAAHLPVPKTIMVHMPEPVWWSLMNAMDGQPAVPDGDPRPFFEEIARAGDELGWPAFLRTDHTSHKHNWGKTCFLPGREHIAEHVWEIAEFSEIASMGVDLSWRNWAVREYLPVTPLGHCPGYGGMPVVREFRFFVDDGNIRCWHPYWPREALNKGDIEWDIPRIPAPYEALCTAHHEFELQELAREAGRAVGGSWSVDLLDTARGWMITDMALADDSFHWEGCEHDRAKISHPPEPPPFDAAQILASEEAANG